MYHDVNQLHHEQNCLCCTFCEVCSESKYQIVCEDFAPAEPCDKEIDMIIQFGREEFARELLQYLYGYYNN